MSSTLANPLILSLNSPETTLENAGGKGVSLARMAAAGLPVPPGFHVTTAAYRRFVEENRLTERILAAAGRAGERDDLDQASAEIQSLIEKGTMPRDIAEAIRERYEDLGADIAVAVRSSATAEDLPGMSFAGQLETYLNVHGGDAVIEAVQRCWESLWTSRAMDYRRRQGVRSEDISIAVVVQQLVPAEAAGIVFTANPMTGARNEVMINAAWGLGEAIVGGRVTPDTMVIDKQTCAIRSQQIADKDVMTTRLHEGVREEAVPDSKRMQAALEPKQAAELARLAMRIEQLYGEAMDIEWAVSGGRFFILQARPVTALPEARPEFEWKAPRKHGRYFRTSVAELLPEPLSPLFATLALPLWNEASLQIVAGTLALGPDSFALLRIHGYAYYEMVLTPAQWVRFFFSLLLRIRAIVRITKKGFARWADETRPRYASTAKAWAGSDLTAAPMQTLLKGAQDLVQAAADYYVSIQLVLALANMSEATFTVVYDRLIKRESDPAAPAFLLGFDSAPIRAEKSLYDLAMWTRGQGALAEYLAHTSSNDIATALQSQSEPIAHTEAWHAFANRMAEHLKLFGHAVYDLDFAKGIPAEEPASQLETLKYFVSGQGRNPHERQAEGAMGREQATAAMLARLGCPRLQLFQRALRWAQRWAPLREEALADVGLGWPELRRIWREIGGRFSNAGVIEDRNDVFWLEWEEVKEVASRMDAGQTAEELRPAIAVRRRTWQSEHGVVPPVALPIKGSARMFGLDLSRWMPEHVGQETGDVIRGIGASPGKVTGPACVIHGPEEFGQMQPGNILVARITTPAWTPLFAMASGIVTDVGGPLSHSSIVAREYRVPAVLGAGTATQRIRGGQKITVDGNSGIVTLV